MRIFLDAYFDNNFGDDLFISTVLRRYPQNLYYVFWKSDEASVLERAMACSNLVILPEQCDLRTQMQFDGYIMIGGDVLPDGIDYSQRIEAMKAVKDCGGFVAMLGFSLYENYGEKTRRDLQTMAALADTIVVRDKYSAERFRSLVPGANVTESTDMAFTWDRETVSAREKEVLGISVRRKLYSTQQEHNDYCDTIASVASGWLNAHPAGVVRFLALSTGEYDDRVTAEDIRSRMVCTDRTEIVAHSGNVEAFVQQIRTCSAMVPTRFHALVFALIYRIPFVPVPYEVKLTQLLDEVGYNGVRIPYGQAVDKQTVDKAVRELEMDQVDGTSLETYFAKAERFFAEADCLLAAAMERTPVAVPIRCTKLEDNIRLSAENTKLSGENQYLKAQVAELEKWVESLQKERQAFDEALQDLNGKYADISEQYRVLYEKSTPIKTMVKRIIRK